MGKECILLCFIEAVYFVDKDDCARAILARTLGVRHDLLDFLDTGQYCRELDEVGFGQVSDDLRQGRFSSARRPPEDERSGIVALDLCT